MERQKYYHGSDTQITDGYLRTNKQFNNKQDDVVSGVFVTSDKNWAKYFAIHHCIGQGMGFQLGNKIILEQLLSHIKPNFYIYTVYEDSEKPFIHDHDNEYYSTQDIKLAESEKFDTTAEIEKLGFEIYVLNEPLKSKIDIESGNNFAVRTEMLQAITENKIHRVDIAGLISQQQKHKIPPTPTRTIC